MGKSKISVEENVHVVMIALNRPEKRNDFDSEIYRDLRLTYGE